MEQDAELFLEAVFGAAVDGIILIDEMGLILAANPATTSMFGHKESEMIGQNVKMLMPSPYREHHDGYLERYRATGEARIIGSGREVDGIHKDGMTFPLDLAISEASYKGRRVFAGIVRDVSERRRMLANLESRESDLRAIIEAALDSIIVIDEYGLIRMCNAAAEQMFQYSSFEMLGRNVKMLMPDPYQREHDRYLQNYKRTGHAKIIGIGREVSGRRKDGTTFPLHLSVNDAESGSEHHYVGILRDLTQEKAMQRAMAEHSEKERALIGQDLHDVLAQQLTALTLMGTTLHAKISKQQPDLASDAEDLVRVAHDAVNESRRLAQGLYPVALQDNGLVHSLREWSTQQAVQFGIPVIFESDLETTGLDEDAALQMYRIAQEAMSNAGKYSQASQIKVQLRKVGNELELRIHDNGCGFDPSAVQSGIGTYSMRHRASLLNGKLEILSSSRGNGTTVLCQCPIPQ